MFNEHWVAHKGKLAGRQQVHDGSTLLAEDMMKTKRMGKVVAEGILRLPPGSPKGKKRSRIVIGQPRPDPEGDWLCPIQIEHYTGGVTYAHGIGSLDALMNAIRLLETFFFMNTVTLQAEGEKRQPTNRSRRGRSSRA